MLEVALPLPYWLEFIAIMTGGLAGAMSAVRARYDIFGTLTIALATGLGGGVIRDILLQDYGIYAFQNPSLIVACLIAGLVVFYFGKLAHYLDPIIELLDNLSVAFWATIGVGKSLSAGLDIIPAIVVGVFTAVGGGLLRDVLMNRTPELFKVGTFYGLAAAFGCTAFALMRWYNFFPEFAAVVCVVVVMATRYGSLIFGWHTRPARDYSDSVTKVVGRPVRFIKRQSKAADDTKPKKPSRLRRVYNRLSGHWFDDDINELRGEQSSSAPSDGAKGSTDDPTRRT